MSMKNSLTPAGIEPATFRFVAQQLNHCATAVPDVQGYLLYLFIYYIEYIAAYQVSDPNDDDKQTEVQVIPHL